MKKNKRLPGACRCCLRSYENDAIVVVDRWLRHHLVAGRQARLNLLLCKMHKRNLRPETRNSHLACNGLDAAQWSAL